VDTAGRLYCHTGADAPGARPRYALDVRNPGRRGMRAPVAVAFAAAFGIVMRRL